MPAPADREKALDAALAQIDRQFGKGSVMRLGENPRPPIDVIPTGSIALDIALGIGGLPRGRVIEVYGPESSGKTTVALHAVANAQKAGGIAAFIDAEHALDPEYAKKLGVDTDALLVSQPDTGEQALEIADMLIRSGALDIIVIDSVAALVPRAEIEGEMGDSHVGLQARLMSQALRKITGALSNSGTTAVFINQLREKIGVMFGCFSYDTRVTLADGSQERIGTIVDRQLDVEVLSYDPVADAVVPRRITNWFDNGPTERFRQFTVRRGGGNGRARFEATDNHLIRTPGGWREAGELLAGDRVMVSAMHRLSPQQWQVVLGGLMGTGRLVASDRGGIRFRCGERRGRAEYADWKGSLFANVPQRRTVGRRAAARLEVGPLPELEELHRTVYWGDGKKHLTWDFLKALTPVALAVWYADGAVLSTRTAGGSRGQGSGRAEVCVEALSEGSRARLRDHLRDAYGVEADLVHRGGRAVAFLRFTTAATKRLNEIIASAVHPSAAATLLPGFRGRFALVPRFVDPCERPVPGTILSVRTTTPARSAHRYDLEIGGTHTYFVDHVMVHNSPETTTGGRALKFYASVRLDVRRIETLKDGSEPVGSRTRVKVVKNKVSPPFKQAEFDILYGIGISREGGLIDMGVEQSIVRKSGAWYTYEGDQLGQGKENARNFLRDNPDLANEIEKRIKEKLGVGPKVDAPAADVDF